MQYTLSFLQCKNKLAKMTVIMVPNGELFLKVLPPPKAT